jgi:TRAP-type C4-dicarboxylate transport system permease small subunit
MVEILYNMRNQVIRRPANEAVNNKDGCRREAGDANHHLDESFGVKIHDDTSDLVIDDEGHAVAHEPAHLGPVGRAAYLIGSAGLLTATATDALAVLGRHTGFQLLGSIEIVQAAVVLIASSAMVAATIVGSHASVHIVTERLSPQTARRLARGAAVLSALLFALFALGSLWVATDLWTGFEQTELLGIPLKWLRALWIAAGILITFLFLRSALRRES